MDHGDNVRIAVAVSKGHPGLFNGHQLITCAATESKPKRAESPLVPGLTVTLFPLGLHAV